MESGHKMKLEEIAVPQIIFTQGVDDNFAYGRIRILNRTSCDWLAMFRVAISIFQLSRKSNTGEIK